MKLHFFICLIPFILFSCTSKAENIVSKKELRRNKSACTVQSAIAVSKQAQRKAVEEYALSLPAEQKIAQLFLVNIEGNTSYKPVEKASSIDSLSYSSAEKKESASKTPLVPGGCLLFSYNIANTPAKLRSFTLSIRRYCIAHGIVPPYTALDQEGGDVNRLRGITSPLPSEQEVASTMTPDRAYELYHAQGIQMQKLGIDMNLAPVSEAATNLNEQFLGTRSFGSLSSVVSFGTACVNGYENAGVASVLKHFPGNSDTDPHTGLPEIKVTEDELRSVLIAPFVRLSSLEPEALLMSHARVSCLDPQTPACLSKKWVNDMIRESMKYDGLILSDDIFMGALADNGFPPEKAAVQAIDAGVDVLMLSEKRFAPVASILLRKASADSSFSQKINNAVIRVIQFKIRHGQLLLVYTGHDQYKVMVPEK